MKRKMAALVVGNAAYPGRAALQNPAHDAEDIAAKLRSYGFEVIEGADCSNKAMDKNLKEFKNLLKDNDVGLFFFAGHGVQVEGRNYLLALDTDTSDETDAKHSSLSLDRIIEVMDKSPAATKIIILDACRDNPWERAWSRTAATRGLASVYAPKGTIIAFATSPGQVASDGNARNGTYTEALLQHIDAIDCPIETIFKRVRNTVAAGTKGKQISWEHTSLSGDFFFKLSLGQAVTAYAQTSLADTLFVIDPAKASHKIIKGLKSYYYYTQNEALGALSEVSVKAMGSDNLFVLGRNIYQAACGGAHAAIRYVCEFTAATAGFPVAKRKALLDGMLFEVFFDPKARLRNKIKGGRFSELFDLEKHRELKDSFNFISEALVAAGGAFYAVPGRGRELAVAITTRKVDDNYRIEAVYIDGADVLHAEDEDYAESDIGARMYGQRSASELREQLAKELVVPVRNLKINYTPPAAERATLKFPIGYSVRKQTAANSAITSPNSPPS